MERLEEPPTDQEVRVLRTAVQSSVSLNVHEIGPMLTKYIAKMHFLHARCKQPS